MSNSDIEEQLNDIYGFSVSTSTISRITDKVVEDGIAWRNRPLEALYLIVWLDGIVFKVREGSKVIQKAIRLYPVIHHINHTTDSSAKPNHSLIKFQYSYY